MNYKIYELSAKAIMHYAKINDDGIYSFRLNAEETRRCISFSAPQEQEDCALFYQAMQAFPSKTAHKTDGQLCTALSDIIVYIDFSGIFDRTSVQKQYVDRQKMAEDMFRPEGIVLDFGDLDYRYVAFERSGNMSRHARLSFVRQDYYAPLKERIMLGMKIGLCQLSKLYAYNGLMLTGGFRVSDSSIWNPRRIIVIDNPINEITGMNMITVEDDGTEVATRKYSRVEKYGTIEVTEFDGEGLISAEYADFIDSLMWKIHLHSSFQIRMPYIKGVLHEVNFKALFAEIGLKELKDIWGNMHPIADIDIILTKSMFKGFGWMTENGLSWAEYLQRCEKYNHALYISGENQILMGPHTELNYQFLNTASVTQEEFRPADLPAGWACSPLEDSRHWLTKQTELAYYSFSADEDFRLRYFTNILEDGFNNGHRAKLARILNKNPLFINEPVFAKELDTKANSVLANYALGKLSVAGDNRYLSGDLMQMIRYIIKISDSSFDYSAVLVDIARECLQAAEIYAPGANYYQGEKCILLRNPHIARNEEAIVTALQEVGYYRKKYLSHLKYVVMVASDGLIPDRLGGADFDGDMVKTIADPVLADCVHRNIGGGLIDYFGYASGIPVLKIPSATPLQRDADDWQARFETVKSTFSTRIGQICNAAFDRSIIGYDENSSAEERQQYAEETELLSILTGLEIDSAKSGIRPDLSDFLNRKSVSRSIFLKYKNIVSDVSNPRWYEPTKKERLDAFFSDTDWSKVTSNVERLPYLAKLLAENTPRIKAVPANDADLFTFAKKKGWKDKLDGQMLQLVQEIMSDYETALARIQRNNHIEFTDMRRKKDISQILFAQGKENSVTVDELYSAFNRFTAGQIAQLHQKLREEQWHLMPTEKRDAFLSLLLPFDTVQNISAALTDFRHKGYRILIDIVADFDDMYRKEESMQYVLHREDDSKRLQQYVAVYERHNYVVDYKKAIAQLAVMELQETVGDAVALPYLIALGKRSFAIEYLPEQVEKQAIRRR